MNELVCDLNRQNIPARRLLRDGQQRSTVQRILRNEKYTGLLTRGKTTGIKDPETGKRIVYKVKKEEWVRAEDRSARIISDKLWQKVQDLLMAIKQNWERKQGGRFRKKQKSYVRLKPPSLLSGNLRCGYCGGSMGHVSGKDSGFFGCLNYRRNKCENKKLVSRKVPEEKLLALLTKRALVVENFVKVYEAVEKCMKEPNKDVPEKIRLTSQVLKKKQRGIADLLQYM